MAWTFADETAVRSIHAAPWPTLTEMEFVNNPADRRSFALACAALAAIHKGKANANVGMGRPLAGLRLKGAAEDLAAIAAVLPDVIDAANANAPSAILEAASIQEGILFIADIEPQPESRVDIAESPASAIAKAYLRARETDPKSSFGDFVAVSEPVDTSLARLLKIVVSDGIIAPSFDDEALGILRSKKDGQYLVFQIDPGYEPPDSEERMVFGIVLRQQRNSRVFAAGDIADPVVGRLTDSDKLDLLVALSTLKYTQSNSIVCATNGQTVGVGAGQQSRIDCTRIACRKSDVWRFRQHPAIRSLRFNPSVKRQERINWRVRIIEGNLDAAESANLENVLVQTLPRAFHEGFERPWLKTLPPICLASDGYLPFPDNVREAHRHHVGIIAHPGGSTRDDVVTETCRDLGVTLVNTGVRAFHH